LLRKKGSHGFMAPLSYWWRLRSLILGSAAGKPAASGFLGSLRDFEMTGSFGDNLQRGEGFHRGCWQTR
jgi:hypothetical protein